VSVREEGRHLNPERLRFWGEDQIPPRGDRRFESASLQRRVSCEPDSDTGAHDLLNEGRWDTLIAALTPANIAVIVSTVASLMTTGFFVGRLLGMYPIESAIVNACHSGQGGTGDIAILTAANRLQLMPFAQIATRIGGAITVTLTLILLAKLA
jgi:hypothetical protein